MVLHVSAALLLTPVAAAAAAGGGPGELIIHPAWDAEVKHHGVFCLDASTDQGPAMQNNTRFSFYAIPEGVPPDGGFPVYVDFLPVNDQTHNASEICGDGWQPPNPWIPPDQEPPSCKKQMHASCPETTNFTRCELCVRAASRQHPEARCNPIEPYIHCPQKNGFDTQHYNTFDTPTQMWASCFHQNGSWDLENCGFNQFAGEMWNARVHQYLLANGIAIVALNPFEEDTWAWDSMEEWETGLDKPYLTELFTSFANGSYANLGQGVLNTQKLIFTGYSAGAQMASFMIELEARGKLPAGAKVAAAVLRAGGSHTCYQYPPFDRNQCKGCLDNCTQFHTRSYPPGLGGECSVDVVAAGGKICCDYCCPTNYTELYYKQHPEAYSKHPPVFLAQNGVSDGNADLCAARMYYDELVAHGGTAELQLISKHDAKCFCMGTVGEPAAKDSPYLGTCATLPPPPPPSHGGGHHFGMHGCEDHTMGFATMVEPLAKFLVKVLKQDAK